VVEIEPVEGFEGNSKRYNRSWRESRGDGERWNVVEVEKKGDDGGDGRGS
jgi:hypothetical protein